MKVKLRSLLSSKRRGRGANPPSSKLLDDVTVVQSVYPTEGASPDTSIETTLGSVTELLSSADTAVSVSTKSERRSHDGAASEDGASETSSLQTGPERTVTFHSASLGVKLTRGSDGFVRVQSVSPDPTYDRRGQIQAGDLVLEMAGVDMRRPSTPSRWGETVAFIRNAPRPVKFVVATEISVANRSRSALDSVEAEEETAVSEHPDISVANRSSSTVDSVEADEETAASEHSVTSEGTDAVDVNDASSSLPTMVIEVDTAEATEIMESPTWELEQEKTEFVEAAKRRQLEEEKARLMTAQHQLQHSAEDSDDDAVSDDIANEDVDSTDDADDDYHNDDSNGIELDVNDLENIDDAASEAMANDGGVSAAGANANDDADGVEIHVNELGSTTIAKNEESNSDAKSVAPEKICEDATDAVAAIVKRVPERAQISHPIDLDDSASDLSSILKDDQAMELQIASAKALTDAARAAMRDQTKSIGEETNEDAVGLNRINTTVYRRLLTNQRLLAREATGGSHLSTVTEISMTREGSCATDVSDEHIYESLFFMNNGGSVQDESKGHLIDRIDDVICSGAVCNALPEMVDYDEDEEEDGDDL